MKNTTIVQIATGSFILLAVICGFLYFREYRIAQEEIFEFSSLRNLYTFVPNSPYSLITDSPYDIGTDSVLHDVFTLDSDDLSDFPEHPYITGLPKLYVDFDALLQINPDIVGWISLPFSMLSYPVVQASDNSKYLNTSFEGKHSNAGTPFADKNNNMQNLDSNTIIHGHNMGKGRTDMFTTLLSYKDYDFFTENRFVQFDTIYKQHGWWEVFAVIEIDISTIDFQYQQLNFQNESAFTKWINNITAYSIHKTNIEVSLTNHILTLSTCDRSKYGENGRLLIFAVLTNH